MILGFHGLNSAPGSADVRMRRVGLPVWYLRTRACDRLTVELSGPARLLSTQKSALTGSAPAICYAYLMHKRMAKADGSEEKASATAATDRSPPVASTGKMRFITPINARPPERIGRRQAGPRSQEVRNETLASRADVQGALIHRCCGRGLLRQMVATIRSGISGRARSRRRSRANPFFASDTFPNELHQRTNAKAQRGVAAASGA